MRLNEYNRGDVPVTVPVAKGEDPIAGALALVIVLWLQVELATG